MTSAPQTSSPQTPSPQTTSPQASAPQSELTSAQRRRGPLPEPLIIAAYLFFAALAFYALSLSLSQTSVADIFAQLNALPSYAIGLSVAAMAVSYLCVCLFDQLSLRYISQDAPLRTTAPVSASAHALSNMLGLSLFGGNAVRFRFFSKLSLSAGDIALITFVASFMLYAAALSLAALGLIAGVVLKETTTTAFGPELSPLLTLGLAALLIAGAVLCLLTLSQFKFGRLLTAPAAPIAQSETGSMTVTLKTRGMHLFLGMMDYAAMGLCLFVLLSLTLDISLWAFLPIFMLAAIAGGVSGLPGGIGVFDAVILLALPRGTEAQGAAALLAYRTIYYLLPLLIVAARQGFKSRKAVLQKAERVEDLFELAAPLMFSVLTFLTGIVALGSAATPSLMPRLETLARYLPDGVIEVSHLLASVIGVVLLLVALGLRRRLANAWQLACIFLLIEVVLSVLKGGGLFETGLTAALLIILYMSKDAFYRKARLRDLPLTWPRFAALFCGIAFFAWTGLLSHRGEALSDIAWWDFALGADASRFLRATMAILALCLIYLFWRVLQPAPAAHSPIGDPEDLARAREIIKTGENVRAEAHLALLRDKHFIFSDSGQSFIMYGVRGNNWVAMGEPVGRTDERRQLIWKFRDLADVRGASPAFYAISNRALSDYIELGFVVQKIGEAATVPLTGFNLEGPARAKYRHARNKAVRNEWSFEVVPTDHVAAHIPRLKDISDSWLARHESKEKGFSLGRFDPDFICEGPVAVVLYQGTIIAFANLWTTRDKSEISIDLMRFDPNTPNGLMDYLFAELLLWSTAQGYQTFNLGMAPLSGLNTTDGEGARFGSTLSRLGGFVYKHGDMFYDFEGLRHFKEKFNPDWSPSYIAATNARTLPIALGNLALLSGGGILGLLQRN